ncbi:sulfotransferase 1B1-like [Ptychodera flava]|uniref:sulfotransferase 1B1-like n=1 Tax=Ptychodera flava TaxID=63121 RepID=UPI003969C791
MSNGNDTATAEDNKCLDKTDTHVYGGVKLMWTCMPSTLDALKTFEVRDDDVFLVTYPKAGTTWLQELVSLISMDGDIDEVVDIPVDARAPHLEITVPFDRQGTITAPPSYLSIATMDSPRLIKTHLPMDLLPRQIKEKRTKVIYVARNPKDLAVSFFHFYKVNPFLATYKAWGDFLTDFMKGDVIYGKWCDHVISWWKERHSDNVLFLKYEDMKKDLKSATEEISLFMGKELDQSTISRIAEHCSFDSMKKNPMTLKTYLCAAMDIDADKESPFVRKGKVGGWKDQFTVAQNEALNRLYRRWMHGTGLDFDFEI